MRTKINKDYEINYPILKSFKSLVAIIAPKNVFN
ncbi:hypothetical protein HNQ88_002063 [Aureibacter tunicatorum]|uniref:Uncharacterized protein n=1 Tax=Aureibacter tunicatorum TaxID=866807 RepID=A0AAE3XNJ6_9BACT|nr:hypothetical protein [Aureibacter tunicatorum]BDD05048.1 hypothetical protein AUTU_25310 [Aureibacter tunicatorum]